MYNRNPIALWCSHTQAQTVSKYHGTHFILLTSLWRYSNSCSRIQSDRAHRKHNEKDSNSSIEHLVGCEAAWFVAILISQKRTKQAAHSVNEPENPCKQLSTEIQNKRSFEAQLIRSLMSQEPPCTLSE